MEVSAATATRTRAQALRDRVEIRLAVNDAGPQIEAVLKANGIEFEADWSQVFPHWLIACVDELVIGCCQVLHSKPVGYIEFLAIHPEVPFKLRAIAIRKLLYQGMNSIYAYGAQYVGGAVSTKNAKFRQVLTDLGFVKCSETELVIKRLV